MKATKYNNYWIQLDFASEQEKEMLEKATSYTLPEAKFSASYTSGLWDGKKKFLTAANKLPAGLFKSLFPDHPLVSDPDPGYLFDDIPLFRYFTHFDRREYQLKAINTIFKHKRGLVAAVVGAGKTLISAAVISKHLELNPKGKVLFVCYDKNILDQTIKNFKAYNLNVSVFGGGTKDLSGDVVVATIQSLSRVKDARKSLASITMCFCDESHHSKSKTSKDVLTKLKNCDYYIGLTATPPKADTLELAELMCVIGPVIYEYGFTDATQAGSIIPVKCFFVKAPFSYDTAAATINRKHYQYIWDGGIKDSVVRNRAIAKMISVLVTLLKAPSLVMVDRTEHGCNIAEQCRLYQGLKFLEMYGEDSVIIRDKKKEYLMKNDINAIISTIVKEGVDFKISPVVAINAAGRKSFVSQIQFLGRIVRRNENFKSFRAYIDFIDTCHPKLREHSEERIQACKDIGAEVVIVDSVSELLQEIIDYYKQCLSC